MRRAVALTVLAATLTVACGDDGPLAGRPATTVSTTSTTTTTTSTTTTTTTAAPTTSSTISTTSTTSTTAAPTTSTTVDPTAPQPPLSNAGGDSEAFSGIAQLDGLGSTCTAFLVDAGPLDEAATALTNAHCVGIFDATAVLVGQPANGATVRFRLFADTPDAVVTVPVTAVAYGSMRSTDVAVLELGATRRELAGLASYGLGAPPAAGEEVRVVGVPVAGLDPADWALRGGTCSAGDTVRLTEFEWLWDAGIASDCTGILGGNSGSPVFAVGEDAVAVGIVNTTTIGAAPGGSCSLGQPCEVTPGGVTEVADRTYAMPLAAWAACWAPTFDIANDGCPAEQPPVVTVEAPRRAVRPGATWAATIGNGSPDRPTVVKSGQASTTDCRDPGGYGEPDAAVPRPYDAPLPEAEGVYVLCAARTDADGAPSTVDAGYAVMEVDATPPDAPIALSKVADDSGVRVEPIFAPPEYSAFLVQTGPAGAIDCADTAAFVAYRRVPLVVPADQLPATMCVIGEDDAGNRGAAQSFPLP